MTELSKAMLAELRAARVRPVKRLGSRVWFGAFAYGRNAKTIDALARRGLMQRQLKYNWCRTFLLTETGSLVADGLAAREAAALRRSEGVAREAAARRRSA